MAMIDASVFISDSNYYRHDDRSNLTIQERITPGLHHPHDSHVSTLTLESNDELNTDGVTLSNPPNLPTDTPPVSAVASTPHSTTSPYDGSSPDNEQLASSLLNDSMMVAGMLTPALAIVPELRSADCLYKKYKNLQGKERDLILAAAHIEDARTGRGRYGRAKYYFKKKIARMAFKVITNKWFQRLIYATVLLHSFLAFFEPPSVKPQSIETYVALSLNLLCLSVYLIDIVLNVIFLSWRVFLAYEERSWIRVQFIFFCCFAIDWILLIAQIASGNEDIVQPFRCLRLAMIVCKAKNVGHITNVVKSITIKLGGVVFIVLIFIVLYSCIGVHLAMVPFAQIETVNISAFRPPKVQTTRNATTAFIETCSSSPVNNTNIYEGAFNHIGTAVYQMFILLTTENYPIIMFPAFFYSQWYFIYFGSFLIFGVFFITSILLAIIADLYWKYNKKHLKKERAKQRAELVKAWKFLDVLSQERLPVDDERLLKLFKLLKPENNDSENRHLIAELDPEHTGWVDWIFWVTQLISVLNLEKTEHHSTNKHSSSSACMVFLIRIARKITAWAGFDKIVLFLIVFHTVLFAVKWEGMSLATELVVQGLRTSAVTVFLLEMCVRLVGKGRHFFKNAINSLDFTLVIAAFVTNVLWYAILSPELAKMVESFLWRGSFVVISSLTIFIRLFFNSKQSRLVMNVFFRLLPVMLDLMILFGIVLYFYGVLGMESFHSFAITRDTPDANHLQYGCGLGFENLKCSLFMVFQILTTSNWHEIMNTVIVSLDSFAPVIYFIPCFIVINFIIMNLLVAIGIEAFNKFSQEQKDEEKEAESQFPSSITYSENTNRTVKEDISHYGQKLLIGLGYFAKAAFSSARMTEEEHNGNSVIHIDIQSNDHATQSRHPSDHMTSESSGYLSPSPSIHRSRLSSTDIQTEDSHSVIIVNQSHELQDIEDNVFLSPPPNQLKPRTNVAMRRQVKMQQQLKKRQEQLRMKSAARTVETAVALQLPATADGGSAEATATVGQKCEVTIDNEGCHHRRKQSTESIHDLIGNTSRRPSIKWGSAAQAILFIGHVASEVEQIESADQFDDDIQKFEERRPDQLNNGPKFRRGYNNGNWRSEVQNLTIINKEEIHELRRQLAAKPSIQHKRHSVDSTDSGDIGFLHNRRLSLERQKRTSITKDWSHDSTLTLNQLELQDTMQDPSKFPHFSSPIDNFISRQSKPNSDPVQCYLTRRRLSSISNELKQSFERRYSSPRNSIEMDLATSQADLSLAENKQKSSFSNASTKIDQKTQSATLVSSVLNENDIKVDRLVQIRSSEKDYPGEYSEIESLDQISDVSGSLHKDGELRNSRGFFKTSLISVEEVAEPTEFPVSDVILLESHKAKKPGPGSRASKEMPDWVNKLAEKYDMTVHSDRSSPPI